MMANSVFSVLLTAFFLLGWIVESRADRPEFAVDHISPGLLLSDPAVVIRSDERSFVWEAPGKGRLHVRQVITLRNADAQAWSRQPLSYDSFRSVEDISGHIYDKDGNQVGRVRNRHITERSAVSGISLAEDAMMKIVELRHNEYPYTFELEYSYTFDGLIGFPAWAPMHRQVALESSRYTIQVPESVDINFATHHLEEAAEPDIQQQGMQTRYTWQLSHQPQLTSVQYGPPWHEMAPRLLVQTPDFEYGDQAGSLKSWESYGQWMHELWQGRDSLSPEFEQQIQALTEGLEDRREIVDVLYQYLQENTRYVSIQLGIGGLQTETAEQTRRTRYGDCKALTNYLYAMLQIVGVESVPALIRSGNPGDDINPELPHQPFNHVILCVPPAPDETQSDSLWVEATSNTFAANYIGLGNAGKHVLMFNESGGRLTRTPALTADDNTQHRRAEVQLSESGEASAKVQTLYGGAQHEPIRAAERGMRPREQHSFLDAHVRTSDFAIEHYSFSSDTLAAGEAGLSLELRLPRYGRVMGNRMFFNPNLMQRRRYQVEENPSRSADIYLSYPYFDTDEIHWELPDGFVPEALPQPVSMMYAFGHFSSRVAYDEAGHRLIFRRELRLNEAQIDAAHYDDFRRMLNEAVRQDDQQVVLVKS